MAMYAAWTTTDCPNRSSLVSYCMALAAQDNQRRGGRTVLKRTYNGSASVWTSGTRRLKTDHRSKKDFVSAQAIVKTFSVFTKASIITNERRRRIMMMMMRARMRMSCLTQYTNNLPQLSIHLPIFDALFVTGNKLHKYQQQNIH